MTAQEIQQQKEDQLKNSSLHTQPKDPYKDKPKLNRFVAEVEKLAKFVEGFEKPLCSGPTPLDVVWKVSLFLKWNALDAGSVLRDIQLKKKHKSKPVKKHIHVKAKIWFSSTGEFHSELLETVVRHDNYLL